MKIGILTFHNADNFGAILQCYALQEYLKSMGHDAQIIDYKVKVITDNYNPFVKFKRKAYWKNYQLPFKFIFHYCFLFFVLFLCRINRHKNFMKFRSKFLNIHSEKYDCDLYVIGSDQVWNPEITNGIDKKYWGEFTTEKPAKKITYAASSSFYDYTPEQREQIKHCLKNFSHIGVRETTLKDFLQKEFDTPSTYTLDPTLLVDKKLWDDLAIGPKKTGYVLPYFTSKFSLCTAKHIAKQKNLEVRHISMGQARNLMIPNIINSVTEFVGAIKFADFVVCTSFHGMVFSIIFNKNFVYLESPVSNKNDRAFALLKLLDIKDRVATNKEQALEIIDKQIDYSATNKRLCELREQSREYLINAIK